MSDSAVIDAIRRALDADPHNGALWLHLAQLLEDAARGEDALAALRTAIELDGSRRDAGLRLVRLLRSSGQHAEALIRAEGLLQAEDDPELRLELALVLRARGDEAGAREQLDRVRSVRPELAQQADLAHQADRPERADQPSAAPRERPPGEDEAASQAGHPGAAPSDDAGHAEAGQEGGSAPGGPGEDAPDERRLAEAAVTGSGGEDLSEWASQFDWGDLRVTFDDVAGLDEVKNQIQLRIIAPFRQPEIYRAFGRKGGGGLLLYGPPGCGKTYVARATAGELGARFVSVSIHEVVDKYWGESEKFVHAIFEDARRSTPTVLFFDEFDALGSSRGRGESQFWKTLVDQLLQEMDGVGARNQDVLLMAATNTPWNVDAAFRRPGRFDRVLFVAPPDASARRAILERAVAAMPGGSSVELAQLAKRTELFTGADLVALAERAGEEALGRSLQSGEIHDVTAKHFDKALAAMQSSAQEWFATARNYARYSNEGGQYDELTQYLKSIRKW